MIVNNSYEKKQAVRRSNSTYTSEKQRKKRDSLSCLGRKRSLKKYLHLLDERNHPYSSIPPPTNESVKKVPQEAEHQTSLSIAQSMQGNLVPTWFHCQCSVADKTLPTDARFNLEDRAACGGGVLETADFKIQ